MMSIPSFNPEIAKEVDTAINELTPFISISLSVSGPRGVHAMQIERLDVIQHDLEATAAHLAGLSQVLEGHARYLRHSKYIDNLAEIDSIEHRLDGLAASILDLRGVASNIAKVA